MRRVPTSIFGRNGFEDAACNSFQKKIEDVIMSELGFFTLKTTGTTVNREKPRAFTTNEENNSSTRTRNVLILIHHYLQGLGFHETNQLLEVESNVNLKQFTVCDNIDLGTVIQEYEAFYFSKFQRYPRMVKPLKDLGNKSHWYDLKFPNGMGPCRTASFPNIDTRHRNITPHNCCSKKQPTKAVHNKPGSKQSNTSTNKEAVVTLGESEGKESSSSSVTGPSVHSVLPESRPTTRGGCGGGAGIPGGGAATLPKQNSFPKNKCPNTNGMLPNPAPDDFFYDPLGRLLGKPNGLTRHSSSNEWADLIQIISKDIYQCNPNVKWDDIVGLDEAKRLIKEAVVYPIKYPQLFQGILSPWRGLLLFGPPGTGKTLLAKAVATECNTTFFNISASSLVSKWRGESEKLVKVLFEMARAQAPSTIFLDELDSLMSHRGSSGGSTEHEGSRRMKTELLIQMDGLACSDDLVFVLAASNLPWELDCAMLRRLEKRILVHLPNKEARKGMFEQHLPASVCKSEDYGLELRSELDYNILAENSEGYSGSDIRLVCKEAAMQRLRQIFEVLGSPEGDEKMKNVSLDPINTDNVLKALEHTKPSASRLSQKYLDWHKQYESL